MRRWHQIFTEVDRALLQKLGWAEQRGYGKNPGLLLIDVKTSFVGTSRKPILEAVEEFRTSCGEAGWDSIPYFQKLLQACRSNGIPVIYVTGDPETRRFTRSSVKGTGPRRDLEPRLEEIVPSIAPLPSELVIRKTKASAFFETPLASCLRDMGIDTLIVGGTTTSGCLRASVVDAYSHGFRCFVVEECTFDRFELSHLVSLWDLNAKYAEVITLEDALEYVAKIGRSKGKAVVTHPS